MASKPTDKQRKKMDLDNYYYRMSLAAGMDHREESSVDREKRLRRNELARARRAKRKAEEARYNRKFAAKRAARSSSSESEESSDSDDY